MRFPLILALLAALGSAPRDRPELSETQQDEGSPVAVTAHGVAGIEPGQTF